MINANLLLCCCLLGLTSVLRADSSISNTAESASTTNSLVSTTLDDKVALRQGDVLSFRILEERTEPIRLTVSDTGEIEFPYIGRVKASRKTCKAVTQEIKVLYERDYFYHATILLAIDVLHKNTIGRAYLTGQVRSPGPLELEQDERVTVSEAILKAGGFSDFADRRRVKLMRPGSGQGSVETTYVDVLEIWQKGRSDKDVEVRPGDQIFVTSKLVNF